MLLWIIYMIILGLVIWVGFKYDCLKYERKNNDVIFDKEDFFRYINRYESQEYDSLEIAAKE